jgi:hypothetical protein
MQVPYESALDVIRGVVPLLASVVAPRRIVGAHEHALLLAKRTDEGVSKESSGEGPVVGKKQLARFGEEDKESLPFRQVAVTDCLFAPYQTIAQAAAMSAIWVR